MFDETAVAQALKESLEAHEAEITFAYSKGHHYGGEVSVADIAKGVYERLKAAARPPCGMRSSVSDATCVLPMGHPADSPDRFHRFAARATPQTALRDALDDIATYEEGAGRDPWNLRSYREGQWVLGVRRPGD